MTRHKKQIALCNVHHDLLHADKLVFKDKKIFNPNLECNLLIFLFNFKFVLMGAV
jgi:hypothetical protein